MRYKVLLNIQVQEASACPLIFNARTNSPSARSLRLNARARSSIRPHILRAPRSARARIYLRSVLARIYLRSARPGIYLRSGGWSTWCSPTHLLQAPDKLSEPGLCLFTSAQHADKTFNVLGGKPAFGKSGADFILGKAREFLPDLFNAGGSDTLIHFLFKIADA